MKGHKMKVEGSDMINERGKKKFVFFFYTFLYLCIFVYLCILMFCEILDHVTSQGIKLSFK